MTTCWPTDIIYYVLSYNTTDSFKRWWTTCWPVEHDNVVLWLTALNPLRGPTEWLDTCDCLMVNCLTGLHTTGWSTDWLLDNCVILSWLVASQHNSLLYDQCYRMKDCIILINWLSDCHGLIDSLTDSLTDSVTDLLTNCLTDWLTNWPINWWTDILIYWWTNWLTDWLTDWLKLADLLACWLNNLSPNWLADWLAY